MSYYKSGALYSKPLSANPGLEVEVTREGDFPVTERLNIQYVNHSSPSKDMDTSKPDIFGPPFWFTLHNGAAHYPIKASPLCAQRAKGFILGIPVMIPCANCSDHATAHIESVRDKLDQIVSGRDAFFKFTVDFHNYVNARYNKPIMSVHDAYKLYTSPASVNMMKYELVRE